MKKSNIFFAILLTAVTPVFGDAVSDALNPSMTFTQGTSGSWYATTTSYTKDGVYQNQSVVRTQSSPASLQTTVSGPGKLSFWWYCNYSPSSLSLLIDDAKEADVSSTYNWVKLEKKIHTSGAKTIQWSWSNTSGYSWYYGSIDDVCWEPAPVSFVLKFDPYGGVVDTPENTFSPGNTYGTLPTPTRDGYVFDGWYTTKHGGRKIVASDYADWEVTEVYARWSSSFEKELEGISTDVSVNDTTRWTSANGMTFDVPAINYYDGEKSWVEAQIEGEAVLSFDFGVSIVSTSTWANVGIDLDVLVDGESRTVNWGESEGLQGGDNVLWYGSQCCCYVSQAGLSKEDSRHIKAFLPPGVHTVKWSVSTRWCQGAEVKVFVENISREAVGAQSSIVDFFRLLYDYNVWRPDNMAYLRDNVYGPRVDANPDDYEARLLRALAKLGTIVDNQKAREIIESCGFVVADYTFMVSGEFCGFEKLPVANDVLDELMPEILSTVDSALDDICAIPTSWSGRLEFVPENYGFSPLEDNEYFTDGKVYIGLAEVSMLRAAVELLRAQLHLAWGYDFEADYLSVSNAVMSAGYIQEIMQSAPNAGSIRNSEQLLLAKEDFRAALESVKRADLAIKDRGDYDTYLLEYDVVDAEEIEECRKLLNQIEASLDGTNTIDFTYFGDKYDTNGVARAKIPGGDFAKELFLGAIFAGKVTRDLMPNGFLNRDLNRVDMHMDSIPDATFGGLVPWLTLNDIARLYPLSQEWAMPSYVALKPEVAPFANNDIIAYCTAERDGNLSYVANVPGYVCCYRDWGEVVDYFMCAEDVPVVRTVQAERGHTYSVHYTPFENIESPMNVFSITEMPVAFADGGPYKETVDGIEWTFMVENGKAILGCYNERAVATSMLGEIKIPESLGGRPVVAIGNYAFMGCSFLTSITIPASVSTIGDYAFFTANSITKLKFIGDEPLDVADNAFLMIGSGCSVLATHSGSWSVAIPGEWKGMGISYMPWFNPSVIVTPSMGDSDFNFSTTLELAASEGQTIYYTLDGTTPTSGSLTYSEPLTVTATTTVNFFAIDHGTQDWGPVGSVTLTRAPAENPEIVVTPSVPDGTRFVGSQYVSLNAGSGKTIYYTTDDSDPMTSLTRKQYTDSVYMSGTTTLKYYAVDSNGDWSPVQTAKYTLRKSDGGPYTETVNGRSWHYRIINGCASIGQLYSDRYLTGLASYSSSTGYRYYVGYKGSTSSSSELSLSSICALDNAIGNIEIPEELGGCIVTRIASGAFYLAKDAISVSIPDSVTEIDIRAFSGCSGLASVEIGNGVTSIGNYAFYECSGLTSVTIGNGVTSIGDYAFYYCRGLTSVTIPDSVTSIGDYAFCYCSGLTSITIPNSVTNIGSFAFYSCSGLTSVTIPDSVTSIGDSAFGQCLVISSILMKGNAPTLGGSYVFSGVPSTCVVCVHKGSTGWGVPIPGTWNGLQIRYIEDVVFPESVNNLTWHYQLSDGGVRLVPAGDPGVADLAEGRVDIPSTLNGSPVTKIGKGAFEGAEKVTSVNIPASVDAIEASAFRECTRLESVSLPEGLKEIGDSAFRECTSLKSVTIPASVTNIGYFAFRDCLRLETVTLAGDPPSRDLGAYMGVPAFTVISGRLGSATAIIYASVTNSTDEITVPEGWLDEIALAHEKPAGYESYQAAFEDKFGSNLEEALKKPTGKTDLHGNALYVWQDYVAGTDPLDEEDKFTATIKIENGLPVVEWKPELPPAKAVLRKYTTLGATALGGEWVDVSSLSDVERQDAGYQFFQVTVEIK